MRKKIYFLLFVIMLSFAAKAQRFEYQLGLKGGLGIDWPSINADDISGKENGLCYKFGLTGIYYFGENYGLTSGFNILGSNFAYKMKVVDEELGIDDTYRTTFKTTYCQIPFLLKMRTDSFNGLRAFGEIGYGLDILVSEVTKVENTKSAAGLRDVCSSFIVHIGAEMEVLNRSTLQLMLGYDSFFSNMMPYGHDPKMMMNNLCVEVGFLF